MPVESYLSLQSSAGVEFARAVDFEELAVSIEVNGPGLLRAQFDSSVWWIDQLQHKSHIEFWRRDTDNAIPWYNHFSGLFLGQRRESVGADVGKFTMYALGYEWLLGTRHVLWKANQNLRSKFISTSAEDIMKSLVRFNAGTSATTINGRIRDGVITGLSVQADGSNGNTVDWYCAWDNLLETLRGLARIAGGDFALVKTGSNTYEFRWYTGQVGTDRTATLEFSLAKQNMGFPKWEYMRDVEKTVVVVGGDGKDTARKIAVVNGADFSATNDVETFYDRGDIDTLASLTPAGNKRADEVRARDEFSFTVEQTFNSMYAKNYFLGDLAKVVNPFTGDIFTQKIVGVDLSLNQAGNEEIAIRTEAV